MSFMITADGTPGSTQVPNNVLLHYILKANGEYAKVYLYLLMAYQYPGLTGQVSVEGLADAMDCTEGDVLRSLHYWEREGLLTLREENGAVEAVNLINPDSLVVADTHTFVETQVPHLRVLKSEADASIEDMAADVSSNKEDEQKLPERTEYSSSMIEALSKDAEMQKTLSGVEKALGTPLTPAHMQLVMYLICDLGFPGDVIIYLYELAASRNKLKPRYIETIAMSWAKKGIKTVADAKNEASEYSGRYAAIRTALGLHRDFAPAEKEIIDGWEEYGLPVEIVEEACKRTVLSTGDTNLKYTTKILAGWHRAGVHTVADIEKADEAYHKKVAARGNYQSSRAARQPKNAFHNFKQRDYSDEDYEAMERQLLKRRESQ